MQGQGTKACVCTPSSNFEKSASVRSTMCTLCKGIIVPFNGPDLTAIAQHGLDRDNKQSVHGVMDVQLLALAVQAKHSSFGSFAQGL